MGLTPCPVAGKSKSANLVAAFIQGAPKHQQGYVFFGVDQSNYREWHKARSGKTPWYYIDNSFFDHTRGTHFRVARGSLQINASAYQSNCKRWDAIGVALKPRNPDAQAIVLCEQSQHFMTNIVQYPGDWLADEIASCEEYFAHRPVIIRRWDRNKKASAATLPQDLVNAWQVRTHTSMAAVTGLIHGVQPATDREHAIARWVFHDDNFDEDRRQLFGVLADAQWTIEELQEGKAWAFLNP